MRFRDTETGAIYDENELFAEYLENCEYIKESSGAVSFAEYIRNATGKNGFLKEV